MYLSSLNSFDTLKCVKKKIREQNANDPNVSITSQQLLHSVMCEEDIGVSNISRQLLHCVTCMLEKENKQMQGIMSLMCYNIRTEKDAGCRHQKKEHQSMNQSISRSIKGPINDPMPFLIPPLHNLCIFSCLVPKDASSNTRKHHSRPEHHSL